MEYDETAIFKALEKAREDRWIFLPSVNPILWLKGIIMASDGVCDKNRLRTETIFGFPVVWLGGEDGLL